MSARDTDAILSGAGATVSLTEAQFTEASTIVLGKLAGQGTADSDTRTLLGPALTPRVLDVLAVLGQP